MVGVKKYYWPMSPQKLLTRVLLDGLGDKLKVGDIHDIDRHLYVP